MRALIRGLAPARRAPNNRAMHSHVYGWDEEPADERPSEFMPSSSFQLLSGYHVPADLSARAARRRRGQGVGFKTVIVASLVLIVLAAVAIVEFVKLSAGA